MARPASIPSDEVTAAVLDAAFAEVERVAAEHGLDADAFTIELLARTVDRYWTGEDRAGLRNKVCGAVASYIDGLFDSLGDPVQEPS